MIKHIFFDADGVVITPPNKMSEQLVKEFNAPFQSLQSFFSTDFTDCVIGKNDLKKTVKPYLKDWGWKKSVDEFLDYWFKSEHYLNHKLVKIIKKLRQQDIKCYLASNQEKYRRDYIRQQMGLSTIFDATFFSCDLGYKKPQLEYFQKIHHLIGLPHPNEVIFIDDSSNNISSARKYGYHTHHFSKIEKLLSQLNSKFEISIPLK